MDMSPLLLEKSGTWNESLRRRVTNLGKSTQREKEGSTTLVAWNSSCLNTSTGVTAPCRNQSLQGRMAHYVGQSNCALHLMS